MKKLLLTAFVALSSFASAQDIEFGAKAGLIFNTDKGEVISDLTNIYNSKGKGSTGFQLGGLTRLSFAGFYIQPEVLYSQFKNEFSVEDQTFKVTKKRFDVPVNVGKTFLKVAHVQAGPVFSYYLADNVSWSDVNKIEQDDFNVGLQVGTGAKISNIMLDVRYEFGLGKMTSNFVKEQTSFSTDTRPRFLNVTVAYLF